MKKIKYRFNDGARQVVTVDDEFYTRYNKLLREERRLERKEKRNTISFAELKKMGVDVFEEDLYDLMNKLEESL